jgi:hypothetical protein
VFVEAGRCIGVEDAEKAVVSHQASQRLAGCDLGASAPFSHSLRTTRRARARAQVLCYEDSRLLKIFSDIVKLMYNAGVQCVVCDCAGREHK